jgi:hypothetical protein
VAVAHLLPPLLSATGDLPPFFSGLMPTEWIVIFLSVQGSPGCSERWFPPGLRRLATYRSRALIRIDEEGRDESSRHIEKTSRTSARGRVVPDIAVLVLCEREFDRKIVT